MIESAWLIEVGGLCIGLCGEKRRLVTFSDPKALRFKTESQAASFMMLEKINGHVREHEWTDTSTKHLHGKEN